MKILSRTKVVTGLGLFVFVVASIISVGNEASAMPPLRTGYFSGYNYGSDVSHARTLPIFEEPAGGGNAIPASAYESSVPGTAANLADRKTQFINFVLGRLGDGNINSGTLRDEQNKVGAGFIIQAMRGGTDRSMPSASDIADWKAKINNPALNMYVDNNFGYSINSGIAWRSPGGGRILNDAVQYNDSGTFPSIIFIVPGSVNHFAVKILCGNPVGDLSGLPNPTPPVPTDYTLTPSTSLTTATAEAGTPIDPSGSVLGTGHAPQSKQTAWEVDRIIAVPGATVPGAANNGTAPLTYYKPSPANSGNSVTKLSGGSGSTAATYNVNSAGYPNNVPIAIETLDDLAAGTKVCWAISVSPRSDTDGNWAHSAPACVVITKKPKVDITGGNLIVGGVNGTTAYNSAAKVITSSSTKTVGATTTSYGSWVEYAILAPSTVTATGSGGAFSGPGLPGTVANSCVYSGLTFTSNGTGTTACSNTAAKGNYSTASPASPDISGNYPVIPSQTLSGTISLGSQPANTTYTATGTLTINTSTIPKSKWYVINAPTANVIINGNITYYGDNPSDKLNSISDVPQLVIIANTISISSSATQVDAWLVAKPTGTAYATLPAGSINTCASVTVGSTAITTATCPNALLVNGPVSASHLYLYRTAGSGTGAASGAPAETFNLRADAYLWAYGQSINTIRIQNSTTTELPPRF